MRVNISDRIKQQVVSTGDVITDVVVVGAGAAGLLAAREIALAGKSCVVLEARDRLGGRIHTLDTNSWQQPAEIGAEFIHGNLPITQGLLREAGIGWRATGGNVWKHEQEKWTTEADLSDDLTGLGEAFVSLKEDLPVSEFLSRYLKDAAKSNALQRYTEGYNAANIKTASTLALKELLMQEEEAQYRIDGGYMKLVDFLAAELSRLKVPIKRSTPVHSIQWQQGEAEVRYNNQSWLSKKVIVAVPLGVLQAGQIRYEPAINAIDGAFKKLGFGNVVKILLQFDAAFWRESTFTGEKDMTNLGFLLADAPIPTWWTQAPTKNALLTGWIAGPGADKLLEFSDEDVLEVALTSLQSLFTITVEELKQKLIYTRVANWGKDLYSLGGYSFTTVSDAQPKELIRSGTQNTIFFAGEMLYEGLSVGTVEAALWSGRDTAQRLLRSFQGGTIF